MNGKKARALRKKVFGDAAYRNTKYQAIRRVRKLKNEKGELVPVYPIQLVCVGKRKEYQELKNLF